MVGQGAEEEGQMDDYSSHRCPAAFRKVTHGDPAVALGTGWWPALSHSLCARPSPPPSYIPGRLAN